MITFTPTGEFGTVVGGPIENGKYQAKGVYPGENVVAVVATRSISFSQNTADMATTAPPTGINGPDKNWKDPADLIPNNAQGNNSKHPLAAGKNKLDLELSSPR
jgi:hypothetical protein